jgi:hypothetical protein
MRGDDPSSREGRRMKLQLLDDEFVTQPVEAVATHPRRGQHARQGEAGGLDRHGVVEGGVEADDLCEFRTARGKRVDGSEIVRQMKRIEWDQRLYRLQQRRGDEFRRDVFRPAVNDSMSDRAETRVAEMIVDELQQAVQRRSEVRRLAAGFGEHGALRVAGDEMRRRVQVFDLAPSRDGQRAARIVEREF